MCSLGLQLQLPMYIGHYDQFEVVKRFSCHIIQVFRAFPSIMCVESKREKTFPERKRTWLISPARLISHFSLLPFTSFWIGYFGLRDDFHSWSLLVTLHRCCGGSSTSTFYNMSMECNIIFYNMQQLLTFSFRDQSPSVCKFRVNCSMMQNESEGVEAMRIADSCSEKKEWEIISRSGKWESCMAYVMLKLMSQRWRWKWFPMMTMMMTTGESLWLEWSGETQTDCITY